MLKLSSFFVVSLLARLSLAAVCNVEPLGRGQDDGPSILKAFKTCGTNSVINLPGYYYVNTVLFAKLERVTINLSGTIQYAPDIKYWSPNSIYLTYQNATTAFFLSGEDITLQGGGTIDGNGNIWWLYYKLFPNAGVAGGSSTTFARPVPLTIGNATNVVVKDISIINSPFWHNFVYQSQNVVYDNIFLNSTSFNSSAAASNSDGWDIYRSDHITIQNSRVFNGDDCVSFKPNSTNILVRNMYCSGSHGISVGSLGQYAGETDIVENIWVENITMINAQNGARIKVFPGNPSPTSVSGGGTGHVKNVTYVDFRVTNVDNPIIVTQCYNSNTATCEAYPSNLTISNIEFIDVTGTSSGAEGQVVVSLVCSALCDDFSSRGTHILPPTGQPVYDCANIVSEKSLDFNCTEVAV